MKIKMEMRWVLPGGAIKKKVVMRLIHGG